MKIRNFQYSSEDVNCGFCILKQPKQGAASGCCPFFRERLEAGVVGYQEAVREAVKPDPRLWWRLNRLVAAYPGTFWVSPGHKRRMEWTKAVNRYRPNANEYYAAMYLLTANDVLYRHTWNCFTTKGIDFRKARLKGISPRNYTLFIAAKDVCTGADLIPTEDLADREIVDDLAFRLMVNARLIEKFGLAALSIRTRFAVRGR